MNRRIFLEEKNEHLKSWGVFFFFFFSGVYIYTCYREVYVVTGAEIKGCDGQENGENGINSDGAEG